MIMIVSTSNCCLSYVQDLDREKITSILDKDMESKAMLELLDRGPVSEGLRESDNMADTPGVTALRE